MSSFRSWAILLRIAGIPALIGGFIWALSLGGIGLIGIVLGLALFVVLFIMADVLEGFGEIVKYFQRQNRKAGK